MRRLLRWIATLFAQPENTEPSQERYKPSGKRYLDLIDYKPAKALPGKQYGKGAPIEPEIVEEERPRLAQIAATQNPYYNSQQALGGQYQTAWATQYQALQNALAAQAGVNPQNVILPNSYMQAATLMSTLTANDQTRLLHQPLIGDYLSSLLGLQ